jgi:hypothetical protein
MTTNNKNVIALIVSGVLLVATAIAVYALQYGLFTSKAVSERINHSEVRAAWDQTNKNLNNN